MPASARFWLAVLLLLSGLAGATDRERKPTKDDRHARTRKDRAAKVEKAKAEKDDKAKADKAKADKAKADKAKAEKDDKAKPGTVGRRQGDKRTTQKDKDKAKPPAAEARDKDEDRFVFGLVKKGDTFEAFARRYRATVADVRRLNKLLRVRRLTPGARLKVRERAIPAAPAAAPLRRAEAGRTDPGDYVVYKVKKGDSLSKVAGKFDVSSKDIVRLNKLGRRPKLRPGATIRIKRKPEQLLLGGVTLPLNDRLYLRTRPESSWGTPGTIALLQEVYARFMEDHPYSVLGVVADISKSGGGYFPPHKSHRRGIDADVGYFKVGNEQLRYLEVVTPDTIDIVKTWDLIRAYINTGHVSVIFMDYRLQGVLYDYLVRLGYEPDLIDALVQFPRGIGESGGLIRHSPGHHHHLHVRFDCSDPSRPCEPSEVALIPDPPRMIAGADPQPRPVRTLPSQPRTAVEFLRARARLHVLDGEEEDTEIDLEDGGTRYREAGQLDDEEAIPIYRISADTSEDSVWRDPNGRLCARPEEGPAPMGRFGCSDPDEED